MGFGFGFENADFGIFVGSWGLWLDGSAGSRSISGVMLELGTWGLGDWEVVSRGLAGDAASVGSSMVFFPRFRWRYLDFAAIVWLFADLCLRLDGIWIAFWMELVFASIFFTFVGGELLFYSVMDMIR